MVGSDNIAHPDDAQRAPSAAQPTARRHSATHGDPQREVTVFTAGVEAAKADDKLHVVYLAGAGRSGSTLLADLLGSTPGMTHAGELRYVWQRGFVENRLCACSEHFTDCAFWQDVREDLTADDSAVLQPAEVARALASATRVRRLGSLMKSSGKTSIPSLDAVSALYAAVQRHSDCAVIIDSSKLPPYALLLDRDPRFHVSIVHLVRDPRGVAFSWGRAKAAPDRPSKQMQQMPTHKSSALWLLWNALTLSWWRQSPNYVSVRYEDFLAEPATTASALLDSLGYGPATFDVSDDGVAQLGANFGIAGNPDRFRTSQRPLQLDDRWKEEMTPWKKWLTTFITTPLRSRFHYPTRNNG